MYFKYNYSLMLEERIILILATRKEFYGSQPLTQSFGLYSVSRAYWSLMCFISRTQSQVTNKSAI